MPVPRVADLQCSQGGTELSQDVGNPFSGGDRRKHARYPYTADRQSVEVADLGGNLTAIDARAVDLSAGGLCLESRPFLYPDRHCVVLLVDLDGGTMLVDGTIVMCEYIVGKGHRANVAFKQPIEPSNFVAEELIREAGAGEAVLPDQGLVVVAGSDEAADRIANALRSVGLNVRTVASTPEVRSLYEEAPIDGVFESRCTSAPALLGIVKSMRYEGFEGPIATLCTDLDKIEAIGKAGIDRLSVVSTSASDERLFSIAEQFADDIDLPTGSGPITGELASKPEVAEAVCMFVPAAKRAVSEARRAFEDGRSGDTVRLLEPLERDAKVFGFPLFSQALERVRDRLESYKGEPARARDAMRRAAHIAGRLVPPARVA